MRLIECGRGGGIALLDWNQCQREIKINLLKLTVKNRPVVDESVSSGRNLFYACKKISKVIILNWPWYARLLSIWRTC